MNDALTRLWRERSERERFAIAIASILIAVALAYAYGWLAVVRERDRLLVRVPELRAEAQALDRDAQALAKLRLTTVAAVNLRATLGQASAATKLADSALEIAQLDSNSVRVVIGSVPLEQALNWVERIQSIGGVRIENIRVASLGSDDRVRLQATVLGVR